MQSDKKLNIILLDPFHTGSHKQWSTSFKKYSSHNIQIIGLPGRNWKWRMHGAAITLADKILKINEKIDVILSTDMLDLSLLISLTRTKLKDCKFCLYFHENQITYPWSPEDNDVKLERDYHYAFINYSSALSADQVFFNSSYHKAAFLDALPEFLSHFPEPVNRNTIDLIELKSKILPLALELESNNFKPLKQQDTLKSILWNHRWEYDKGPDLFFNTILKLDNEGVDFKLIVLGEGFEKSPPIFDQIKEVLADKIIHFGYSESRQEYFKNLAIADLAPVTSNQDFFGGSAVEAIFFGAIPLFPERLAFPEHIPKHLKDRLLYNSNQEFEEKLKLFVEKDILNPEERNQLRDHVARYDWNQQIELYDTSILECVNA